MSYTTLHQYTTAWLTSRCKRAWPQIISALFKEQIDKTDYVANLLTVGRICFIQEQWGQALSYFKQALRLEDHIENLIDVAHAHFSIGYVYFIQERWEQAIVQLKKSLKIYERLEDNSESFVALNLNLLVL